MRVGFKQGFAGLFVILSLLYLGFVLSVEQRRMIGDDRGWDPGSRALPLGAGVVMLASSLYLVVREGRAPRAAERVASALRKLVALAIVVSVLYVLLFRAVGFVLATNLLLFTLIFFNNEGDLRLSTASRFAAGAAVSTLFVLSIYTAGRIVTRSLFLEGRRISSDLLRAPVFTASVSLAAVAAVFALVVLLARQKWAAGKPRALVDSVLVAAGTTELLYLVFRQVFLVGLAPGLISW